MDVVSAQSSRNLRHHPESLEAARAGFRVSALRVSSLTLVAALSFLSCAAALPKQAHVRRVIDGDTVELDDGRLVRYTGIDAPEVRRRAGDRWVVDPEPFGEAATEANKRLVGGRTVRLEYDVQTHDRFGRLLAYVYVGHTMINAELIRNGFAQPLTIPPNVKYAEQFRALAEEARRAQRGLWGLPTSQRKHRNTQDVR